MEIERRINKRCMIVLPSFQDMGGGTRVMVTMMDELSKQKFEVIALTIDGFPQKKFKQFWEIGLEDVKALSLCKNRLPKDLNFLLHPLLFLRSIYEIHRRKPDLVIYSDDVIGFVFPFLSKRTKTLLYVHFPLAIKIRENLYLSYPSTLLGKAFFPFKKWLMRLFLGKYSRRAGLIIANSSLTKNYIERYWERNDVKIVFPPVDVKKFEPALKKENSIALIGAIARGKNQELAIKALSNCKTNPKLHLVGIVREPHYLNSLKVLVKNLGLEHQVFFHINASFLQLKQIIEQSKIIISTSKGEPFGIAVVEGMTAGCVPLVHKSGGPWNDTLEQGKYGFGFESKKELAKKIDLILTSEELFKIYSRVARERAQYFSSDRFRREIIKAILSSIKRR
ncbi:glycosyltransferase [Dehalococcoidales bacterium]|nr:glycosyltransferase [Dehalococcoidales bacterium]